MTVAERLRALAVTGKIEQEDELLAIAADVERIASAIREEAGERPPQIAANEWSSGSDVRRATREHDIHAAWADALAPRAK